jgi:hypothetical protein
MGVRSWPCPCWLAMNRRQNRHRAMFANPPACKVCKNSLFRPVIIRSYQDTQP